MSTIKNKQRTISKEVSLTGVGLHTGSNVTIKFLQANHLIHKSTIKIVSVYSIQLS